jgi:hypothetical protein
VNQAIRAQNERGKQTGFSAATAESRSLWPIDGDKVKTDLESQLAASAAAKERDSMPASVAVKLAILWHTP